MSKTKTDLKTAIKDAGVLRSAALENAKKLMIENILGPELKKQIDEAILREDEIPSRVTVGDGSYANPNKLAGADVNVGDSKTTPSHDGLDEDEEISLEDDEDEENLNLGDEHSEPDSDELPIEDEDEDEDEELREILGELEGSEDEMEDDEDGDEEIPLDIEDDGEEAEMPTSGGEGEEELPPAEGEEGMDLGDEEEEEEIPNRVHEALNYWKSVARKQSNALKECHKIIRVQKEAIDETNLFNKKLRLATKLNETFNLNKNQKVQIFEQFDNASTLNEAILVYRSIKNILTGQKEQKPKKSLKEYASSTIRRQGDSKLLSENFDKVTKRWQELALKTQ